MSCRDVRKKMTAWGARSLSGEEARAMAAHLSDCRSCRRRSEVAWLKHRLLEATRAEGGDLSAHFLMQLRARLGATAPVTPSLWEGVRAFGQALAFTAVLVLMLIVGIHLYIRQEIVAENTDFFRLVAERNFSSSEQVILADDRDLTSDQVLRALIAERGQR